MDQAVRSWGAAVRAATQAVVRPSRVVHAVRALAEAEAGQVDGESRGRGAAVFEQRTHRARRRGGVDAVHQYPRRPGPVTWQWTLPTLMRLRAPRRQRGAVAAGLHGPARFTRRHAAISRSQRASSATACASPARRVVGATPSTIAFACTSQRAISRSPYICSSAVSTGRSLAPVDRSRGLNWSLGSQCASIQRTLSSGWRSIDRPRRHKLPWSGLASRAASSSPLPLPPWER